MDDNMCFCPPSIPQCHPATFFFTDAVYLTNVQNDYPVHSAAYLEYKAGMLREKPREIYCPYHSGCRRCKNNCPSYMRPTGMCGWTSDRESYDDMNLWVDDIYWHTSRIFQEAYFVAWSNFTRVLQITWNKWVQMQEKIKGNGKNGTLRGTRCLYATRIPITSTRFKLTVAPSFEICPQYSGLPSL